MSDYNLLTKRLFEEGYTKDNYPDYIKGFNSFYGGFEYKRCYLDKLVYITPCGLHCKSSTAMGGMSFDGINWEFENDCPVIHCPYYKKPCDKTQECFRDREWCAVHQINKEWTYNGSVEELQDRNAKEKERLKQEFIQAHNGRVCEQHMRFDPYKKEWLFNYDPTRCANGFCHVQHSSFADGSLCPVLNKVITREKGNVYYDVRFTGRDYTKDGTLFEGERFEQVVKDVPLYSKPISLEIAKAIAKLCREHIEFMVRYNSKWFSSITLYKAERGEIDLSWKVENIRAEKRVVRDLLADLEDIDNGVQVVHEIDERKRRKEEKTKRKQEAKDKKVLSLERKIIKNGLNELSYSEQKAVGKYIDPCRQRELNRQHEQQAADKPKQLSLFDL